MKLRYTRRAHRDIESILAYLTYRSPNGARNVLTRLEPAARQIAAQPLSGQETDIPSVRVLFAGRYPYKLFYRLRDDHVEILHIRHTSREPQSGAS